VLEQFARLDGRMSPRIAMVVVVEEIAVSGVES
jgi:hypothetical protein